ncbi:fatty acid/phospholipid synthesis protein [Vibrio sp. AND4]|nr:fatty acid/phospholipid synthesis protein [Vibrio sp. AND4]
MRMAIDLVSDNEADACVSAGNTGALMALSRFVLKLLPGIERPALVSSLPTISGQRTWMLDLGANVSCDADSLFQFAVMGSALAEEHLGRPPRVALLNIGAEEIKGNDVVKCCAEMLSQTDTINFVGYIEGNQILHDAADVIVCDGFVGNVCLKASEGTAQLFIEKLKSSLMASTIKGWIARKLFSRLFNELKTLNPDQYNGASLLGLRGIVIKSHGSADVSAIVNALGEAVHEVKRQVPSRISDRLEAVLLERHY